MKKIKKLKNIAFKLTDKELLIIDTSYVKADGGYDTFVMSTREGKALKAFLNKHLED